MCCPLLMPATAREVCAIDAAADGDELMAVGLVVKQSWRKPIDLRRCHVHVDRQPGASGRTGPKRHRAQARPLQRRRKSPCQAQQRREIGQRYRTSAEAAACTSAEKDVHEAVTRTAIEVWQLYGAAALVGLDASWHRRRSKKRPHEPRFVTGRRDRVVAFRG